MENLMFSLNAVLPLLLLIVAGYVISRSSLVSQRFFAEANGFVFRIAMPFMLCRNIYSTDFSLAFDPVLVAFSLGCVVLVAVVSSLVAPLFVRSRQSSGAIIQALFRGNFAFFGLPLALNLFGQQGAAPTSMLISFTVPVFAMLAVIVLTLFSPDYVKKPGSLTQGMFPIMKDIVRNPLILGSLAGLVINVLPVTMPKFLDKAISDIGAIATPLALVVLGSQFDFSQLQGRLKTANLVAICRLVLVPLSIVSLAALLGFRGPRLGAVYILFAAPTSVTSYVMARDMNSDHVLAGQLVILTTLLCGVTLFIGIFLLRTLGLI